jgi:hypothetical protein
MVRVFLLRSAAASTEPQLRVPIQAIDLPTSHRAHEPIVDPFVQRSKLVGRHRHDL